MAEEPGNRAGSAHEPGLRIVDSGGDTDHRRLALEIHESTDPLLDDIEIQLSRLHDLGHAGSQEIIADCRDTIAEIRTLISTLAVDEGVPGGS